MIGTKTGRDRSIPCRRNKRARWQAIGRIGFCLLIAGWLFQAKSAEALDLSIPRIGGDISRGLLGDGTGVVVGVVDSGIDDAHPALSGTDGLGQPRLVAERNFVPTEPENTGEDPHGHGTAVSGVILGRDDIYLGLAPDARYVNARALDADNGFDAGRWPENASGWAIDQGVDLLNLSLNFFSTSDSSSGGSFVFDRLLDWAAYDEPSVTSAVCIGNISDGSTDRNTPRSPAGSYNTIAVGQTGPDNYARLRTDSAFGPTSDGRMKPDIVAPGASITSARAVWETGSDFNNHSGCSFATPHVTGVLAQLVDKGRHLGQSTSPQVLKAVLLSGAEKSFHVDGTAWQPFQAFDSDGVWEATSPLDQQAGAGLVDAAATARIYLAGEQGAGDVSSIGWDENIVVRRQDYQFDLDVIGSATITTTLTWLRHVVRTDDGDGEVDSDDQFTLGLADDGLDNLDLELLADGVPVARSRSTVDNVEHLHWEITQSGRYTLQVQRVDVDNDGLDEPYAIAWLARGFLGDLVADGVIDVADIDQLSRIVRDGRYDNKADLDQDGQLDQRDRELWVTEVAGTYSGDANLDGVFDSDDIVHVFVIGQYLDDMAQNSGWSDGDWNGDGDFDAEDFVTAFVGGGYNLGPRATAVPESLSVWQVAVLGMLFLRRVYPNGGGDYPFLKPCRR